tara:strand:- start:1100 stop:1972 length:873 start_codon:yes stop_codon:yes gene_type:complete
MSDSSEVQSDPKVEAKATSMGWVPQEKFRGDTAKWVDAQTFVERGEQFMPLLKANNRRLEEQHHATLQEVQRLQGLLESSQTAIAELKEFHDADTRRAVEATKRRLLSELTAAKRDGDVEAEVQLTDELSQVNAALKEEPKKKEEPAAERPESKIDPAFTAWQSREENSWFGKDRRKTTLAIAIAQELRQAGDRSVGEAFYEKVSEELDATLGAKKDEADDGRPASKVGGSRGGAGGSSGSSGGKAFKDLPADAKAACHQQGAKLVGEGKAFKTQADWQTYYADLYFKEN